MGFDLSDSWVSLIPLSSIQLPAVSRCGREGGFAERELAIAFARVRSARLGIIHDIDNLEIRLGGCLKLSLIAGNEFLPAK